MQGFEELGRRIATYPLPFLGGWIAENGFMISLQICVILQRTLVLYREDMIFFRLSGKCRL